MKQKILDATNGGLDIILSYYPQAQAVINKQAKFFKVRNEATASASLKEYNGVWYVTDFGDDQHGRNCFDVAMKEENLPFAQVIHLLAQRYNIDFTLKSTINKPTIESRPAKPSDPAFTYTAHKLTEAERKVFGPFVTEEVLKNYNYLTLESYSITTKDNKFMTFTANDNYPIFMHDCGSFKKIYKPLEYDKDWRFFTAGTKPKDYINGLDIAKKKLDKLQENEEEKKLPEIILCSGERDAMNIAGMGYNPIWLNSESAELNEAIFGKLSAMAYRVYNLPDIDNTGIKQATKLALQHLDIFTIILPSWLKTYRDHRGRPRKDLRDFLDLRPYKPEFAKLMATACQCKFWHVFADKTGRLQTEIKTTSLLFYLKLNGFYQYKNPLNGNTQYIKINGYKVTEYEPKGIRSFILSDLRERQIENHILDAVITSKRTTVTIADDLEFIEIDFTKSDNNSRTLFFDNVTATVYANRIEQTNNADNKHFSWEKNISPHTFKELVPAFTFEINKETGKVNFEIKHTKSALFAMLINASRMYWKEEFETRATGIAELDQQFAKDYKFSISSPRVTDEEYIECYKHLLNKIYAIGYQLHRYKYESKALALWIMENKLTAENESSGGSGKSVFAKALKKLNLLNIVTLEGRRKNLTENKHMMERITSDTDILLIDDAHRYFDFDAFFSSITGDMVIDQKQIQSKEMAFKDAPIISITSNFPMPESDKSTMRRLLPVVFSDYYHFNNGDGTYKETRTIADDFGKDLWGDHYTEAEYNADINFCINCLQFYLSMNQNGFVMYAPMENILKRINISKMGELFQEWADIYFSAESYNLNCLVNKQVAWCDFLRNTGASDKQWKINRFMRALRAYAENDENIVCMNPPLLTGYDSKNKRIMRKRVNKMQEYIYLQTKDEPLHNESFNDNDY